MKTIDTQIIEKVCSYTGLTEKQYLQLVYDIGLAYLAAYLPNYPAVVTEITKSEDYWDWWKYHWEQRDKEFIETCELEWLHHADGLERHKCIHDPLVLASAQYLNGQVLEQTYSALMQKIIDKQPKHQFAYA